MHRFRAYLLAACSCFALSTVGQTASKDIDITITHGSPPAFLTTYTVRNEGTTAKPAGSFISGGQGFRRGDVLPGNCVKLTSAAGVDLKYQLDEIATRRQNGDDNSILFLVWSAQTDTAIPAGGTYQVKFTTTSTPCSTPTGGLNLSYLTTHDLKLKLDKVKNQDGTQRGTGNLVFELNKAIANTGRDAPRRYAQGPVVNSWIVQGPPRDPVSGVADPALYVQCYIDLITDPTTQTTLGSVRHTCLVLNSWMNVAAGSVGNSGAPGPVGLPNDPQAISYRPTLLDGSTVQLDWAGWDQSVTATANPVKTGGVAGGCAAGMPYQGNGDWTFPNSVGQNVLQHGMALWYHTDGVPPAAMSNDKMYFVYANGNESGGAANNPNALKNVHLLKAQFGCPVVGSVDPTDQGTGVHNFSWQVWQAHNTAWLTTDQNAADNITTFDRVRTANVIYPALTAAEQTYWKETGIIPPVRNTVGMSDPIDVSGDIAWHSYTPLTKGNQHSGNSPGIHANLAQMGEYASQAFLGESRLLWDHAVIGSASYYSLPWSTILNERTGRIPAVNNGRPGANHAGDGTPYTKLGAPFGNVGSGISMPRTTSYNIFGITPALDNVPYDDGNNGYYRGGMLGTANIDNSHFGSYHNGIYAIWGRRRDLEALYFTANRSHTQIFTDDGFGRQTNTIGGVRYYAQIAYCCEGRGEQNAYRDRTLAAALGGDGNDEKLYFGDMLNESYWYQLAVDALIDGTSTNFRSNFTDPWQHAFGADTFMDAYGAMMAYQGYAMLRDPLSLYMLKHYLQLYISGCSDTDPTNVIPSFYCATYQYNPNLKDGGMVAVVGGKFAPNTGKYYAADSSERGLIPNGWAYTAGSGVICQATSFANIWLVNGDKAKPVSLVYPGPDELRSDTWYSITNVQNTGVEGTTNCFQLINPATGVPFTKYTSQGQPFSSTYSYLKTRPTTDRPGWASGYSVYAQPILYALHSLGFNAIDTAIRVMSVRSVQDGFTAGFIEPGPVNTRQNWDPNILVK